LLPTYEDDYESEMPTIPFRTHRDGMVTGAVRKLRSLQASWAGRLGMFFGIAAVTLAAASLATILPRIRRGPRERVGFSPSLVAAEAPMMNPTPGAGGSGDPPGNGPPTVPSTVPTAPVAEQLAPSSSAQAVELGDAIEIPSEASNPPNATAGKENAESAALSPSPTSAPSPGSLQGQSQGQSQGQGQGPSQSQGDSRRAHGTKALSEDPEVNEIVFRTVPKNATVTVDGVAVTGRTRRIPRPRVGRVLRVDIRAEGYEDEVIFVDDGSVSPMTVLLSARTNEGASARRRERSKDTIEDAGRGVAEENAAGD
jgi:hypothetical protein